MTGSIISRIEKLTSARWNKVAARAGKALVRSAISVLTEPILSSVKSERRFSICRELSRASSVKLPMDSGRADTSSPVRGAVLMARSMRRSRASARSKAMLTTMMRLAPKVMNSLSMTVRSWRVSVAPGR